jgi:hypothetical protein
MGDLWRGSHIMPRWFATPHDWFNRSDGRNFEQGPCEGRVAVGDAGSELWTWNTSTSMLVKVEAPWESGCQ